jgi:dihydroorotase
VRLLIKNGRVIDPASGTDETLDILIADGKIVSVEARIEGADAPTIDASRLVVAPGFIDMHTHVREPGHEKKEDISSASRAAAKGGFTTICAMPNTNPVNDSRRVTEYIIAESRKLSTSSPSPLSQKGWTERNSPTWPILRPPEPSPSLTTAAASRIAGS